MEASVAGVAGDKREEGLALELPSHSPPPIPGVSVESRARSSCVSTEEEATVEVGSLPVHWEVMAEVECELEEEGQVPVSLVDDQE